MWGQALGIPAAIKDDGLSVLSRHASPGQSASAARRHGTGRTRGPKRNALTDLRLPHGRGVAGG